MSRTQFNLRNNLSEVLTIKKSGSTSNFIPNVQFSSGSKRVSWKLYNGVETKLIAGNAPSYTGFSSDTSIRDVEIRCSSLDNINYLAYTNGNIYGNLNLSQLNNFGGYFNFFNNPKLTGVTHGYTTTPFTEYNLYACNIIGELDLSLLPNLGGQFRLPFNYNLTGVTHTASSEIFTIYYIYSCNLIGNHDTSMLSNLGGDFRLNSNPLLTGVTHGYSNRTFTTYTVESCNLIGNLDLTMFPNLGGFFNTTSNINLTGITHTATTKNFTFYGAANCNLIGNLDLTMLSNLGGSGSSSPCAIQIYSNSQLSGITFPLNNNFYRNTNNSSDTTAMISLYSCNLDYVDFKSFSGATLLSGSTQGQPKIRLQNNNMSAEDVNHILIDFSGNATYNPAGWSNVSLNIGGTNADPDSSSGGYNGLAAISFLTGSPYNWTITY